MCEGEGMPYFMHESSGLRLHVAYLFVAVRLAGLNRRRICYAAGHVIGRPQPKSNRGICTAEVGMTRGTCRSCVGERQLRLIASVVNSGSHASGGNGEDGRSDVGFA